MDDYITLAKLIQCLELHLKAHGNKQVISVGVYAGKYFGLDAPFSIHLQSEDGAEVNLIVPSFEHDVDKFIKQLTEKN